MIEVVQLSKQYGATKAVDGLTFTVHPGAVTGFLGPNGAGKSTTMRMILGLDSPTSGHALIDGKPYAALAEPLTRVGALLDANWVHPTRSARAHLSWMAVSNGLPTSRVDQVLDMVGLTSVAGKAVGKFSLGMRQRLGLAGALLGEPDVLLFDEPVNGLDPEGILWIRTFMKSLAAGGRTVLVSSHLLSEMALTADRLVVIGKGRLIADASTADFIAGTTQTTVRVRSPQLDRFGPFLVGRGVAAEPAAGAMVVRGQPIERIGELAAEAGIVLHELATVTGSLEEAFLQLTGDSVEYGGHGLPSGGAPPGPPGMPGLTPPPGQPSMPGLTPPPGTPSGGDPFAGPAGGPR